MKRRGIIKSIRYFYWVSVGLLSKNLKTIVISFLVTVFLIISMVSLFPFLFSFAVFKYVSIGYVGNYKLKNLPMEILEKISYGLVSVDEKGQIIPRLAERWEFIEESNEYRFYLKKNLRWNTGKEVSASDLNYPLQDVKVQALDKHIISFKLKEKLPIFPIYLTDPLIRNGIDGINGQYSVESYNIKNDRLTELVLKPNGLNSNIIKYRFYRTESDLISAYKLGEIDEFTTERKAMADLFNISWKNTEIIKEVDYNQVLTAFFNMKSKKWENKDIRQAVAMLINRDLKVFSEAGESAYGPIPSNSWAYFKKMKKITYNPDIGKKILSHYFNSTESAYIKLITYIDYLDVAEVLTDSLQEAGVKVNIKIQDYGVPREYDIFLAMLRIPNDPDQYYFWHSTQIAENLKQIDGKSASQGGGNVSGYNNQKIDKLLEDGRRNTINTQERKAIYESFQKVFADNPPAIFFYHPYKFTIRRKCL